MINMQELREWTVSQDHLELVVNRDCVENQDLRVLKASVENQVLQDQSDRRVLLAHKDHAATRVCKEAPASLVREEIQDPLEHQVDLMT